ncbi:MAG: amidohydrolase [bacterium]
MIITNGKIYTMEEDKQTQEGPVIENGFVRVQDGKIQEIGEMNSLDKSSLENEEVFDAQGGYVLPGIIDAHAHLGLSSDATGWQDMDINEVIEPVTPELRAIDGLNPLTKGFEEARDMGITTIITGPGSANLIGGQLVAVKTYGKRVDDIIIKAPVAMKMALGENPKRVYGQERKKSPFTRMSSTAIIRETLFKVQEYIALKEHKDASKHPKLDFRLESLIPVLKREIPAHIHCHKADDIYTAIRIAKEFDLDLVIVHGTEGHLIVDDLQKEGYGVISGPHMTARSKPEVKNKTFKSPGVLANAGILTSLTVDHPVVPIENLLICAGLAVREGMSELDALKSVTINGAINARIQDRVGSLRVGKDADIAVFNRHPFDLQTQTTCVLIDGKRVK